MTRLTTRLSPIGLRYAANTSFIALTLTAANAQYRVPAMPRYPVSGAPVICGRKIEQFALLQNVDFTPTDHFSTDPVHGIVKGLLLPVSEDTDGVFYHASNGVIVGRPNPPFEHENVVGGVYVSKTKPGLAYAYTGDARNRTVELHIMSERLRKEVLAKLLVASNAPSKEKPKSKDRK
jgi:hypothetical protein